MKIFTENKLNSPPIQSLIVWIGAIVAMVLGWLFDRISPGHSDPLFPWSIATAFMLCFAILNSVLSLRADSFTKYWQASMYSYMALAFATGLTAWLFSGIPLGEAGYYKWIYMVVSIGFIVFLTLVNLMKTIVRFAEKEEWNEPRKRDR